ncbi:MAG: zinc-dependent metalloprotease [Corynebacterium sp.]|nr:zinc-dependent metalloprotease [Corynebacterium sp.]
MNNNGFGFSFNFGGGDDDRDKNNPGGGLGDMLNQLGNMLSGMGNTMSSGDASPVNYSLAERIARQEISGQQRKNPAPAQPDDTQRAQEAAQLVELWLEEHTILPASNNQVTNWDAERWLQETLPMWKRMISPIAESMSQAQLDSIPEEAREAMGPMVGMMNQMSSMNFGMNVGHTLGDLALQIISGTDFGLPLAPTGITALLVQNIRRETADLDIDANDVLYYVAAREVARQRLFTHVSWLREQLIVSIEEYAAGLVIDTSHVEEAMRELNIDGGDPAAIQEAMSRLQNSDLSPRITSRNLQAATRLATLLALIEGWVDYVVTAALEPRMPHVASLDAAWQRRRESGGSADRVFSTLAAIEFDTPPVAQARELWRRVTVAVGVDRRDHIWDHPDFLPGADDLENSAEFIDGLLDTSDDFDPIAEITKLEEMLQNQKKQEPDNANNASAGDDTSTGSDSDGENPDSPQE